MNLEDTRQVLRVIRVAYPHSFSKMTKEDKEDFLAVWSDMFVDDDPMLVMTAVKSYIRSNPSQFAPSVGQITELMHKLSQPKSIDADTAWNMVYKALGNSAYNAKEQFAKLPPEVQAGVGSPDQLRTWALMDNSEVQTVIMSMFKKGYSGRIKEKKDFDLLPDNAKNLISNLTQAKKLENS